MVSFPQGFPPKSCMELSCLLYMPHGPPISLFLVDHPNIWWRVAYRSYSSSLCRPLHSPVSWSLYPPQHPILEHTQPIFLPNNNNNNNNDNNWLRLSCTVKKHWCALITQVHDLSSFAFCSLKDIHLLKHDIRPASSCVQLLDNGFAM